MIIDESYFARPVNAPNMQRLMTRWGLTLQEFNSLPAVQKQRVRGAPRGPPMRGPAAAQCMGRLEPRAAAGCLKASLFPGVTRSQPADTAPTPPPNPPLPALPPLPQVFTLGGRLSGDGMGSDWYETAALETDQVLGDFIQAVTPSALTDSTRQLKFLHRVSQGDGAIKYVNPLTCPYFKACTPRRPLSTCPNVWYSCADGVFAYGARIGHCPSSTCRPACYCCGPDAATARCGPTCSTARLGMCANPQ